MLFLVVVISIVLLLTAISVHPASAIFAIPQEHGTHMKDAALMMLGEAVAGYGSDPKATIAAIHDTDDSRFHSNGMYVFVVNDKGTLAAHGIAPHLIGTDISLMYDVLGTNIGKLIRDNISPYGQWIQYYWPHSESNRGELNAVFVKTHWDHTFGVGIQLGSTEVSDALLSEQDRERQRVAQDIVDTAIIGFAKHSESVISDIHDPNDRQFRDGEIYAFIYASNGTIVAHGGMSGLAGTDSEYLRDGLGANMHDLIVEDASPYGRWIEYWWPNPAIDANKDELKLVWVRSHGDHVFGAGIYPESPDDEIDDRFSWRDKEGQQAAQNMVDAVIRHMGADIGGTVDAINDQRPAYNNGPTFVMVAKSSGEIMAHGQDASLVGSNIQDLPGTYGKTYLDNASPHGKWIEHNDESGNTRLALAKSTGLHVVVAVMSPELAYDHEEPLTHHQIERQQLAKAIVEYAIEAFASDPVRTVSDIHDSDNLRYRNGEIFVFIVNTNGTVLAHGGSPGLQGTDTEFLADSRGTGLDDLWLDEVTPYGKWIEYYWPNPVENSNMGELKWTWVQLHAEYVFGAGIYPEYTESLHAAADAELPYFVSPAHHPQ